MGWCMHTLCLRGDDTDMPDGECAHFPPVPEETSIERREQAPGEALYEDARQEK